MDRRERRMKEMEVLSTEEIEDRLARKVYGPDFIPLAESIIRRRKEQQATEQSNHQLEAADTIASETRRLATATEQLRDTTSRLARATWGLFWSTAVLVLATVVFNILK